MPDVKLLERQIEDHIEKAEQQRLQLEKNLYTIDVELFVDSLKGSIDTEKYLQTKSDLIESYRQYQQSVAELKNSLDELEKNLPAGKPVKNYLLNGYQQHQEKILEYQKLFQVTATQPIEEGEFFKAIERQLLTSSKTVPNASPVSSAANVTTASVEPDVSLNAIDQLQQISDTIKQLGSIHQKILACRQLLYVQLSYSYERSTQHKQFVDDPEIYENALAVLVVQINAMSQQFKQLDNLIKQTTHVPLTEEQKKDFTVWQRTRDAYKELLEVNKDTQPLRQLESWQRQLVRFRLNFDLAEQPDTNRPYLAYFLRDGEIERWQSDIEKIKQNNLLYQPQPETPLQLQLLTELVKKGVAVSEALTATGQVVSQPLLEDLQKKLYAQFQDAHSLKSLANPALQQVFLDNPTLHVSEQQIQELNHLLSNHHLTHTELSKAVAIHWPGLVIAKDTFKAVKADIVRAVVLPTLKKPLSADLSLMQEFSPGLLQTFNQLAKVKLAKNLKRKELSKDTLVAIDKFQQALPVIITEMRAKLAEIEQQSQALKTYQGFFAAYSAVELSSEEKQNLHFLDEKKIAGRLQDNIFQKDKTNKIFIDYLNFIENKLTNIESELEKINEQIGRELSQSKLNKLFNRLDQLTKENVVLTGLLMNSSAELRELGGLLMGKEVFEQKFPQLNAVLTEMKGLHSEFESLKTANQTDMQLAENALIIQPLANSPTSHYQSIAAVHAMVAAQQNRQAQNHSQETPYQAIPPNLKAAKKSNNQPVVTDRKAIKAIMQGKEKSHYQAFPVTEPANVDKKSVEPSVPLRPRANAITKTVLPGFASVSQHGDEKTYKLNNGLEVKANPSIVSYSPPEKKPVYEQEKDVARMAALATRAELQNASSEAYRIGGPEKLAKKTAFCLIATFLTKDNINKFLLGLHDVPVTVMLNGKCVNGADKYGKKHSPGFHERFQIVDQWKHLQKIPAITNEKNDASSPTVNQFAQNRR